MRICFFELWCFREISFLTPKSVVLQICKLKNSIIEGKGFIMKFNFSYIVCAIVLVSKEIVGFDFIREILFPRAPLVRRIRHGEEARFINDEEAVFDTAGLIEKHGYPAEEHNVTTEDGYNIIFFRMPESPKSLSKKDKPVVLLMHGMFGSSDSWVLLGPDKDFAFFLVDAGYDVWIGNMRGNSYGRSHSDISPRNSEFWDFSFHEIGMWDLPKMIDYILEYTNRKDLFYIGHSMGTTICYILLSSKPDYNDKIRLFVALAPVAFWKGPPNPLIRLIAIHGDAISELFDKQGIYDLAPQTTNNVKLARTLCSDNSLTQPACIALYFLFAGDDPKQLNTTYLPTILSYVPAGASTKTLYHYRQNIMSGIFQPYDSGYIKNFKLYGKKKPPIYDVKKISTPVAIIYGKRDALSLEPNVIELAKKLKNVVTMEAVPFDFFNHLDFIWGINAKELLFDRVMEIMLNHRSV